MILTWLSKTTGGQFAKEQIEQAYQYYTGRITQPGAVAEFYSNVDFAYDWISFNLILANNAQGDANFTASEQGQLIQLLESARLEALQKYGNNVDGANYLWKQFTAGAKTITDNDSFLNVLNVAVVGSKSAKKYVEEQEKPALKLPWYFWLGSALFVLSKIR